MNWKEMMGLISTITILLPIFIIAFLRLHRFKCFLALGIYYVLAFCSNLISEGYINVGADFKRIFSIAINMLDAPLMLIFLAYFSSSLILSKRIRLFVLFFIAFELLITFIYGYNKNSITIIMAPGLVMILGISAWFFLRQIKITILHQKATGKVLMISSMLFAYGCYALIYVMYYLVESNDVSDIFLMYFIAGTLSALILSAGMMIENKRIRKLEELKITRKELHSMYGESHAKMTVELEKEQWN
jgi:hypothetical protein